MEYKQKAEFAITIAKLIVETKPSDAAALLDIATLGEILLMAEVLANTDLVDQ